AKIPTICQLNDFTDNTTPFWQKVNIVCRIEAGQTRPAGLAADILREQGENDPDFFAAVDALILNIPMPTEPETDSPPTIALYAMARAKTQAANSGIAPIDLAKQVERTNEQPHTPPTDLRQIMTDEKQLPARRARALAMLATLGESVPVDMAADLITGTRNAVDLPESAIMTAMDTASRNKRTGETVLLATIALGSKAPSETSVIVLEPVITALMRIELHREAVALACEALSFTPDPNDTKSDKQ
ncbi:MAG: hypothetical protein U9N14_03655, partial [Pseudomonadota bacterium]|nr:hypothetical protein [Pseudomonadota bacterium]